MQSSTVRVWVQSPERFFESGFMHIASTRMSGLPITNPRLRVRAFGFERFGDDWMGCVITPWSILVVLVCGNRLSWQHVPVTKVRTVRLPSGDYDFMGMNDPILGEYQVCSLMSPVTHLSDQRTAEAVAQQALWLMRQPRSSEPIEENGMKLVPAPFVEENAFASTRRAFLSRKKS